MEPINRRILKENGKLALKRNFWMIMLVAFVGGFLGAQWSGLLSGGGSINLGSLNFDSILNSMDASYTGYDLEDSNETAILLARIESVINQNSNANFHYDYNTLLSDSENIDAFFKDLLDYYGVTEEKLAQILGIGIGVVLLLFVVVYVISVCLQFLIGSFLYAPIGVGYRRYFMLNRKGEAKFTDLFYSFSGRKYMQIVGSMFSTNIRIFGWSLLFYFPGLVKWYEYYFVPYIMAENPDISKERAREISKKMTDGHKWQMFVLGLSFLGWSMLFVLEEIVLALISCGILAIPGILLCYPLVGYIQVTWTELYAERREYALMTGIASEQELKGF